MYIYGHLRGLEKPIDGVYPSQVLAEQLACFSDIARWNIADWRRCVAAVLEKAVRAT